MMLLTFEVRPILVIYSSIILVLVLVTGKENNE